MTAEQEILKLLADSDIKLNYKDISMILGYEENYTKKILKSIKNKRDISEEKGRFFIGGQEK